MKRLPSETRVLILRCLVEGNSIRATERLTGATKRAVTKLLVDAGRACAMYQDRALRNLRSRRVQVDEVWSFTAAKQRNVSTMKRPVEGAGDTWTWTAIDADSKLLISWLVGGRDGDCAKVFIDDLASRLATRVQLTSDGHKAYLEAVEGAFGDGVDYAQLVKVYGETSEGQKRYSPAAFVSCHQIGITGKPNPKHISTSFAERQNLTMRMHMRRFTRLTNAFSKKIENHAHAVALHCMHYNFARIHSSLRVTPAMAAGVSDRLWELSDILALVEEAESVPKKRGPYKKRASL